MAIIPEVRTCKVAGKTHHQLRNIVHQLHNRLTRQMGMKETALAAVKFHEARANEAERGNDLMVESIRNLVAPSIQELGDRAATTEAFYTIREGLNRDLQPSEIALLTRALDCPGINLKVIDLEAQTVLHQATVNVRKANPAAAPVQALRRYRAPTFPVTPDGSIAPELTAFNTFMTQARDALDQAGQAVFGRQLTGHEQRPFMTGAGLNVVDNWDVGINDPYIGHEN